ncbi:protachykinin [Sphaeramia orbicularis]|uniref:protachykinin n=1 Tax=Sphaeramia orbicularis TaxID=375764 RepID=UPI00117BEC3F|nr:protachykinin-like [Sphaeramia orbicularis]
MEIVRLVIVFVLIFTNVLCEDTDVENRRECTEENWANTDLIQDLIVRMMRKPGLQQYLRSTGRKSSAKTQASSKRHKFQTFVGLMGKRSYEDQGPV